MPLLFAFAHFKSGLWWFVESSRKAILAHQTFFHFRYMQSNFYAHGKLMLTGEYFVLDGAKTLAIPTRFGQKFQVKELNGGGENLFWVALDNKGKPWLQAVFNQKHIIGNSLQPETEMLAKVLNTCKDLNSNFLAQNTDIAVQTQLEFPRNWGLGSSSTLIYCIAKWANINAFELLEKTFGGSGYDVACAGSEQPILFWLEHEKPTFTQVAFEPAFKEQILFVHLGKKQHSTSGIAHYRSLSINKKNYVDWLNVLTESMINCNSIQKFIQVIQEHESYVAEALQLQKVKKLHFEHLPVAAKSLGAWGGDFAMLAFEENPNDIKKMLHHNGFETVLTWNEMFL